MIGEMERDGEGATTIPPGGGDPDLSGIGAYVFSQRLGAGGMGTVWLARHRVRPGLFAVKVLKPHLAGSAALRARFEREARLGIGLRHPGIVQVLDFVVDGGLNALVMEYVEGETLLETLRRLDRPLLWPEAEPLFRSMLSAMAYAHRHGVIHRDIKPGNVLLARDGSARITDFGIAHVRGASGDSTRLVLGTVRYTAPELFAGEEPSASSDVYSLGMTLYRVATGQLPFPPGASVADVIELKRVDPPPPSTISPGLPAVVDSLVCAATRADPARRPSSCGELLSILGADGGPSDDTATPLMLHARPELASATDDLATPLMLRARPELNATPEPVVAPLPLPAAWEDAATDIPGDRPPLRDPAASPRPPRPDTIGTAMRSAARFLPVSAMLLFLAGLFALIRGREAEPLDRAHSLPPTEAIPQETATGMEGGLQEGGTRRAPPSPHQQPGTGPADRPGSLFPTPTPPGGPGATRPGPAPGSVLGAPPERGRLDVRAVPGAWVVIAGQRVARAGPAGVTLDLEPGDYKVRLVCDDRELCPDYERTQALQRVTVKAGSRSALYMDFGSPVGR